MHSTEPVHSEVELQVLFATNKHGSPLYCTDYTMSKGEAINDAYPMPKVDECLNLLGGVRMLSTLYACSEKHNTEIEHRYKDKTTFTTDFTNHYKCCRSEEHTKHSPTHNE